MFNKKHIVLRMSSVAILLIIIIYPILLYANKSSAGLTYLITSLIYALPVVSAIMCVRQHWLWNALVFLLCLLSMIDMGMILMFDNYINAVPEAELAIGGKVYYHEVTEPYFEKWRAIDGISVLGFIDDINAEYASSRATISPIFSGAGTNIKLVESMQRKRVCITTDCGMRGMSSFVENGKDVLVSSNAEEFASLCIKALSDEAFNHQIAKNAYEAYTKSFAHEAFNKIVGQIMTK